MCMLCAPYLQLTYGQQNLTNTTPGQCCTVCSAVTSALVPPLISLNAVLQNVNISFLFYAPLVLNCCSRILTIISLSLSLLCLGDRLVKVNGQNILGKTYSQVMMLIQCRCKWFTFIIQLCCFFFNCIYSIFMIFAVKTIWSSLFCPKIWMICRW